MPKISLLFILLLAACSRPETADLVLSVTGQTTAETPSSERLYSHFIEIGFGYQVPPLMAERFFNRSFEPFVPYNGKSKNSFGLLLGDGAYIQDWSGEAWYHSGYEHNAWYAAPGDPGNPALITDTSHYLVPASSIAQVQLIPMPGGCGHGHQFLRIINTEPEDLAGLAQDGKWLESGKSYQFRGYFRSLSGELPVEICLYPEGSWEESVFTYTLPITEKFESYTLDIPHEAATGRYTFALFIPPGSQVDADAFSLLPEDHFFGWKPATMQAIKQLNPGVIRFPGGCFASFYDWKNGIGDPDSRKPEPSFFWGGMNYNDFGTAEYAMMCREVGAEMMICINMHTPGKEHYLNHNRNPWQNIDYALPQFTDFEKGVQEAVDWLAYCNLEAGEHPMADLRVSHGFKEPFGVQYWEMDNETVRWFSPEAYARAVVTYSKAMKAIDPSIKIGMVTYDFTDHIPDMLEIAGAHIDFFADRDDSGDDRLDRLTRMIESYNQDHHTDIKYCNTEWQVHPYGAPNPKEEVDPRYLYGHQTSIKRAMVLGTWYCGLKAAGYLLNWQQYGEVVDFVNFNNFSNTHGQAVIETPKEGAYLTAPGKVYELLSRSPARWPLCISEYQPSRQDLIQGHAAWSLNKDTLVLFALNRTDTLRTLEFKLDSLHFKPKTLHYSVLDADDIFARSKIDLPDEIRRKEWETRHKETSIRIKSLPRSFTQVVCTETGIRDPGSDQ